MLPAHVAALTSAAADVAANVAAEFQAAQRVPALPATSITETSGKRPGPAIGFSAGQRQTRQAGAQVQYSTLQKRRYSMHCALGPVLRCLMWTRLHSTSLC